MNKAALHIYQEKILSILKLLGDKDSLRIPEIDMTENTSNSTDKQNSVIPLKRIK